MFLRVFRFGICFAQRFGLLICFQPRTKGLLPWQFTGEWGEGVNNKDD